MNNLQEQFLLKKDITYLNFGSFGACVKPVFQQYQQFQLMLEEEPVHFITEKGPQLLAKSREALAAYINCSANDVVYVTNPSYAVNIIAKSFKLQSGDEVLTTNLEYGACDRAWQYYCQKAGAVYKQMQISLPLTTTENFVEEFFRGVTAKTKLIFISHITSSTALRLPVEEVIKKAKELNILTFVDGAHGPAQVTVDMQTLNADIYTGACHKWMLTPKGSSFLYVKKEWQHLFDPLIISWGYNALFPSDSQFLDYHQMQGTRDFSAFLTIPAAINFMQQHNWQTVAANCRSLVYNNATEFCNVLQTHTLAPLTQTYIAQMLSVPVKTTEPEKLHDYLYTQYKIQIPVMRHANKVYLRYSINAFNTQEHLNKLFAALQAIKKSTNLIET